MHFPIYPLRTNLFNPIDRKHLHIDSIVLAPEVKAVEQGITIDGREVEIFNHRDPADIPWGSLGVDYVIESTGLFTHSDQSRAMVDQKLGVLIDVIGEMNERMDRSDTTTAALDRVAVGQETMIEVMRAQGPGGEGMDAESRMRLRSIDVQMLRQRSPNPRVEWR